MDVWLEPTNDFADSANNLSSTEMTEVVSQALTYSTVAYSQKKTTMSSKSISRRLLMSDK